MVYGAQTVYNRGRGQDIGVVGIDGVVLMLGRRGLSNVVEARDAVGAGRCGKMWFVEGCRATLEERRGLICAVACKRGKSDCRCLLATMSGQCGPHPIADL